MNTELSPSTQLKVVLFDVGSTLIHCDAEWPVIFHNMHQALYKSLVESGLDLVPSFPDSIDVYLSAYLKESSTGYVEQPVEMKITRLLGEFGYHELPEQVIKKAAKDMYAVSQECWQPEEDALPAIKKIKSMGYRMGVISNADFADDVETLIDKGHFRPFMEIILISAREGMRKPHPAMFQKALDYFKEPASQVVMVGDRLDADVAGANQMGIASVWICRRADLLEQNDHIGTIHPDAVIEKLSELPDLLSSWNINL
jgi:HAD superfamily hydrolase (TIGR01662 family)